VHRLLDVGGWTLKVQRSSVCALVSGGLDSCVMLAELARRYRKVSPVFICEGLIWEPAELHHLRRFLRAASSIHHEPLTILHLPVRDLYGAHWSITGRRVPHAKTPDQAVYLPGRNLLLLSKAAVFCAQHRIGTVAVGLLGHNPFRDATPQFFRDFAAAAGEALGLRLKIVTPFRRLTKAQVIRRGRHLPLHLSFSCLSPRRGKHCGRCNKCAERQRAFRLARVADETRYAPSHAKPPRSPR
jgi:7-cyano-7-deazaguanine synthase